MLHLNGTLIFSRELLLAKEANRPLVPAWDAEGAESEPVDLKVIHTKIRVKVKGPQDTESTVSRREDAGDPSWVQAEFCEQLYPTPHEKARGEDFRSSGDAARKLLTREMKGEPLRGSTPPRYPFSKTNV